MTALDDLRREVDRLKASVRAADVIRQTMPLKREGKCWTAQCPFHADRTPSFRVYPDHYYCFGCGAWGDIFDWLEHTQRLTIRQAVAYLGGGIEPPRRGTFKPSPAPREPPRRAPSATANSFLRCWDEGVDPAGTIVEVYLRNRGGLTIPDGAPIRFHPRCQRGPRDLVGGPEYLPTMLALMTDAVTGDAVGCHRTYLQPDGSGKAPDTVRITAEGHEVVLSAKRILGTWGVIRLEEWQGDGLGLAEGIETALTISQRIGWRPVWAAGCRGIIAKLPTLGPRHRNSSKVGPTSTGTASLNRMKGPRLN